MYANNDSDMWKSLFLCFLKQLGNFYKVGFKTKP